MDKTFVGFGFGPIQSALFLFEAFRSGKFSRFVVAEVDREMVEAVRANGGAYTVNIARPDGIEQFRVEGVDLLHPEEPQDREKLLAAIAQSDELATALPAVRFYKNDGKSSVARLLGEGFSRREKAFPTIVYAAENHNDAAAILAEAVAEHAPAKVLETVETLDTVIGKMSGLIADAETIQRLGLAPVVPGHGRAVLVEEFNRILVSRPRLPDVSRGIDVFLEKEELLPFEEAKLYGHNAIHALMGYLADLKNLKVMAAVSDWPEILALGRKAFIEESGGALVKRHRDLKDPLFTEEGYREYADDLLDRMVNPYLNDLVERVVRDPVRKLGYEDRLYGTMRLALEYGIEPRHLAIGAAAALACLVRRGREESGASNIQVPDAIEDIDRNMLEAMLVTIWKGKAAERESDRLVQLTWEGLEWLRRDRWL